MGESDADGGCSLATVLGIEGIDFGAVRPVANLARPEPRAPDLETLWKPIEELVEAAAEPWLDEPLLASLAIDLADRLQTLRPQLRAGSCEARGLIGQLRLRLQREQRLGRLCPEIAALVLELIAAETAP